MTDNAPTTGIQLSSKTYDKAKFGVQIVLPALGVLYASLAGFWGLPNAEGVVGTITAVALFLGVVMRLSSRNYDPVTEETPSEVPPASGNFVVTERLDGSKTVSLELGADPEELIEGDSIVFTKKVLVESPAEEDA